MLQWIAVLTLLSEVFLSSICCIIKLLLHKRCWLTCFFNIRQNQLIHSSYNYHEKDSPAFHAFYAIGYFGVDWYYRF